MVASALPTVSQAAPQSRGLVRVVSNEQMVSQERAAEEAAKEAQRDDAPINQLAQHIRARMTDMRNFRNAEGIAERLLHALRTYKGEYSPTKLQEIRQFQGSDVYARITSSKCRAATALLRDVYLGPDRPWDVDPTPDPEIPDDIEGNIQELVRIEIQTIEASGQAIDQQAIADRVDQLRKAAKRAAKKKAHEEADVATSKLNDVLTEGGFYEAFAEFLIDLPIFPFAAIKGPVVRNHYQTKWVNGQAVRQRVPKMFWQRVSPFDLYWSPGAGTVMQADYIERLRLTRAELTKLRGLPGYDDEALTEVLGRFYNKGLHEWWDSIDTERAELEDRERWSRTATSLIDCAEFTGHVSGQLLLDWGMSAEEIPEPTEEYFITAWLIDRWVIKVQINPSTNQRPPYYISSFEKVPGSMLGNGVVDLLEDIQTVCNATARALVNNLSIASGPQVAVNDAVLSPGENDQLYPWKRWHFNYDPYASNAQQQPISFFQPNSNAAELLGVFEKFNVLGDEVSSIPRYMTGNEKVGGAGRTASGLAMLMGNASKTLQNVAASIDRDVVGPVLRELYDMIMLTAPETFRGDEQIVVKGVNHAAKREQDRMRQLEFLQLTANPIDMGIVGLEGRANVLRSVANNLGLEYERVVPDDEELAARMQQQAMAQMAAQPPGQQPGPQDQRAGPEAAREQIEGDFTGPTGRPGMRMGG